MATGGVDHRIEGGNSSRAPMLPHGAHRGPPVRFGLVHLDGVGGGVAVVAAAHVQAAVEDGGAEGAARPGDGGHAPPLPRLRLESLHGGEPLEAVVAADGEQAALERGHGHAASRGAHRVAARSPPVLARVVDLHGARHGAAAAAAAAAAANATAADGVDQARGVAAAARP